MLHVPGMPEGVHVSFSPEAQPVSAPAQPDRYTPPAPVGAGTPSEALTALLDAHELAYGHALCSEAYGLPDLAERRQAEEEAFRALLHTPLTSDADRAAYAAAVISRQMHSLGDGSATERDHPMAVAYRNLRFGEHAREPEEMRHVGRVTEQEPETTADPILAAIAASKAATAAFDAFAHKLGEATLTPEQSAHEDALSSADLKAQKAVWQTVPTTPAGRRALVEFARFRVARNTHPDGDVDDAGYLFGLVFDAFAAMVEAGRGDAIRQTVAAAADPILAAIEVHRNAHAAWYPLMCAWNDMTGGTPEYEAAEAADGAARQIERETFRTLLNTRPTTVAGCLAFTAYLSSTVVENDHHLDEDTAAVLRALRDSAAAPGIAPTGEATPAPSALDYGVRAKLSAEQIDLSAFPVRELSHLYEAFQVARFSWEGVTARGYHDRGQLGDIPDYETERAGFIMDRIAQEIASRTPSNDEQRDDILVSQATHEMMCNGRIHDPALLHDIATAWGA